MVIVPNCVTMRGGSKRPEDTSPMVHMHGLLAASAPDCESVTHCAHTAGSTTQTHIQQQPAEVYICVCTCVHQFCRRI